MYGSNHDPRAPFICTERDEQGLALIARWGLIAQYHLHHAICPDASQAVASRIVGRLQQHKLLSATRFRGYGINLLTIEPRGGELLFSHGVSSEDIAPRIGLQPQTLAAHLWMVDTALAMRGIHEHAEVVARERLHSRLPTTMPAHARPTIVFTADDLTIACFFRLAFHQRIRSRQPDYDVVASMVHTSFPSPRLLFVELTDISRLATLSPDTTRAFPHWRTILLPKTLRRPGIDALQASLRMAIADL